MMVRSLFDSLMTHSQWPPPHLHRVSEQLR
jgi:hypothetical protein